jgi:pimeloyl-ACP methyl ester carboxylesterase
MESLPVIYVRGYAGPTAGIDTQVDDPFYGFNRGATHVRVGGDGDPMFYQFEGPMLRLMIDQHYQLLVQGDQHAYLVNAAAGSVAKESIWVYRFYDQAATTFVPPPHENVVERLFRSVHQRVTADGFDLETAAVGLYDLVELVLEKTGAPKVFIVAHSMGGLVARCMIQKVCLTQDARDPQNPPKNRRPATEIVAKLFTYGTPHGGIAFNIGALNWAESAFGPAGSDIFAPEKMYGYLTPGRHFGDTPGRGDSWDPQRIPDGVFSPDDVFCVVGTDPSDYGLSRVVVGPKSDGLVMIEHAYVRGAHRAFVHKSHSGSYGEVNSEEGYQNLRRFLFGRWQVQINLDGLPTYPADMDQRPADQQWAVWQADMRLAVRGLPVVLSEQQAAHWCPIEINEELKRLADSADHPVPLVQTFLLDPAYLAKLAGGDAGGPPPAHGGRARYAITLRVYKLVERKGSFDFSNHLEQVSDWADTLIVDVGPNAAGTGLAAYMAWNSQVPGANDAYDPITAAPAQVARQGSDWVTSIPLPAVAKQIPVLGPGAEVRITVTDREAAVAQQPAVVRPGP